MMKSEILKKSLTKKKDKNNLSQSVNLQNS